VPKLYGSFEVHGYVEGVSMSGLSGTEEGVVKVEILRHSETLRGIQSGRIGAGVFGSWQLRSDGR
jgi:hypothetical protein